MLTEGTASLGLREIARRAGVSHGAPRRHFPTHHALLSAIARRGFADLGARFATAARGAASPHGQLRALGRAYVAYALECRGMFELMFRHDLLTSENEVSGQPPLRESTLPLFEHFAGLVARCRADRVGQGSETPQDAETPAAVIAAALWSICTASPSSGPGAAFNSSSAPHHRWSARPTTTSSTGSWRPPSTPTSAR